jgi:hypothetical protein
MSSTELITSEEPTFGETLDEALPLVDTVPLYGPPVIFLAAPWLLLCLMLAGPFALVFTFVVLLVALAVLIGSICAIVAAPFLLVRQIRRRHARRASVTAPVAQVGTLEPTGAAA